MNTFANFYQNRKIALPITAANGSAMYGILRRIAAKKIGNILLSSLVMSRG